MSSSESTSLPDFMDSATFASGVPHAAYRRLRDEAPVSWHARPDEGYWLLTRHRDVYDASVDWERFSSWRGSTQMDTPPSDNLQVVRLILLNMDPPDHTRYRRLLTRGFAARAIDKLEPRIRAMAVSLVDKVAPLGSCDFVNEIACDLPLQVILELLGVPEPDRHRLFVLSNQMIAPDDEQLGQGDDVAMRSAMEMYSYAFALASERRAHPGDDLISHLIGAEVEGERLTDGEINAFFLLLVVAGNETTRNLLSGGLQALFDHPEARARVQSERGLLPSAVEEMLRYVSPIKQFRRTANCDIELHGQKIRAGDKVILAHVSANHDERVFAHPERFDPTRSPNPHVAFGVGAHLCLGAALARLEARIMFEEIFRRLPDIAPAGPPRHLRSNFVNGFTSLPVRFTPAR
jgi:cholest-4-en-3-one 26-monooxygenase